MWTTKGYNDLLENLIEARRMQKKSKTERQIIREADRIVSAKENFDALSWTRVEQIADALRQEQPTSDQCKDMARELLTIAQANKSLESKLGIEGDKIQELYRQASLFQEPTASSPLPFAQPVSPQHPTEAMDAMRELGEDVAEAVAAVDAIGKADTARDAKADVVDQPESIDEAEPISESESTAEPEMTTEPEPTDEPETADRSETTTEPETTDEAKPQIDVAVITELIAGASAEAVTEQNAERKEELRAEVPEDLSAKPDASSKNASELLVETDVATDTATEAPSAEASELSDQITRAFEALFSSTPKAAIDSDSTAPLPTIDSATAFDAAPVDVGDNAAVANAAEPATADTATAETPNTDTPKNSPSSQNAETPSDPEKESAHFDKVTGSVALVDSLDASVHQVDKLPDWAVSNTIDEELEAFFEAPEADDRAKTVIIPRGKHAGQNIKSIDETWEKKLELVQDEHKDVFSCAMSTGEESESGVGNAQKVSEPVAPAVDQAAELSGDAQEDTATKTKPDSSDAGSPTSANADDATEGDIFEESTNDESDESTESDGKVELSEPSEMSAPSKDVASIDSVEAKKEKRGKHEAGVSESKKKKHKHKHKHKHGKNDQGEKHSDKKDLEADDDIDEVEGKSRGSHKADYDDTFAEDFFEEDRPAKVKTKGNASMSQTTPSSENGRHAGEETAGSFKGFGGFFNKSSKTEVKPKGNLTKSDFGRFKNIYNSRDGGLALFEDGDGHITAVDSSRFA